MRRALLLAALGLCASGCSFIDDWDSFRSDGGAITDGGGVDADAGHVDAGPEGGPVDGGFDGGPCTTTSTPIRSCNSVCVDTNRSHENCGDCDHPCGASQSCTAGTCGDDRITQIVAGSEFACVLRGSGRVACWGRDGVGQLGTDSPIGGQSSSPIEITGLPAAVSIVTELAAGTDSICGRSAHGDLYCWGDNYYGQLGYTADGTSDIPHPTPMLVAGIPLVSAMSIGYESACAIADDASSGATVYCWGNNSNYALGVDPVTHTGSWAPLRVDPAPTGTPTSIGTGTYDAFNTAIYSGHLYAWGYSSGGVLGTAPGPNGVATEVPSMLNVDVVHAGSSFACARVVSTGGMACWGDGSGGRLGRPSSVTDSEPIDIGGLHDVTKFAVAGANGCAIGQFGGASPVGLYCWGANTYGILGNSTPIPVGTSADTPIPLMGLPAGEVPVDVAVGDDFGCVLTASSNVFCFGENSYGQCGVSAPTMVVSPVAVTGLGG